MLKNIVLTGLMGSGKTSTGKILALQTGLTFVDTDDLIVQKIQKPITKIFEENGEAYFRDIETEIIQEISQQTKLIISTGGGAVLREKNIQNLKKTGVLFYLQAEAETLHERIKNDSSRPLLQVENPLKTLEILLKTRKTYYEKSNFTINTEKKTPEQICKQIIKIYNTCV